MRLLLLLVVMPVLLMEEPRLQAQESSPSPRQWAIPETAAQAAESMQRAGRSSGEARLNLLLNVVRYRIDNQLFEQADDLLQSIFTEFGEENGDTLDSNDTLRGRYHASRARVLLQSKNLARGLAEAERARFFAEQSGALSLFPMVYRTLGNTFVMMRDYAKALDYFQQALEYSRKLDSTTFTALTLNSIAIAHWRMKQWADAEYYLRQARKSLPDSSTRKHMFDNNIAVAIMEQGQFERARELLQANLQRISENDGSSYTRSLTLSNLADVHQRMEQPGKALQFADRAMDIPQDTINAYIFARTLRHKARALLQLDRTEESIATCTEALRFAEQISDPAEQMDTYGALIEIYESAGRFKDALQAMRQEISLREEILSRQTRLRGVHFQVQYETAERERRLRALEQEQQIQQWQRNGMLAIVLISLLLAFILYSRYRLHQRANLQITRQKEEIERSHHSLQTAYQELESANAEKDEILAIAAHDIRNPIGGARQLAEMLRDEETRLSEEDRRSFAEDIVQSSETVLDIVANLLDINRLERSAVKINWQLVRPAAALQASIDAFQHEFRRKNQHINLRLPDDIPEMESDPGLLRQILVNLLSNAIKYSPLHSTINAGIEHLPERPGIRFFIRDEGPGMTREDQMRLFQKFARLSARPTGGETSTGLGLSIVHKLVHMLKGEVHCESVLGHGTTFVVEFSLQSAQESDRS